MQSLVVDCAALTFHGSPRNVAAAKSAVARCSRGLRLHINCVPQYDSKIRTSLQPANDNTARFADVRQQTAPVLHG
ncbi:hypothetical protein ACN47E_002604 [Coniothyrium glycines]